MKKRLCKTLCPYYKPSKNKELACKGFSVVERLLQRGKKIVFKKSDMTYTKETGELIVKHMCITCPYYENDCDFIQHRTLPPCGGFTILEQLFESGSISLNDIIRSINECAESAPKSQCR